jgi:glutamyl-tRNA reductase
MIHQTGLGGASVSLARVDVALAREIFESFEGKAVLLIGAGEMAESALRGLRDAGNQLA